MIVYKKTDEWYIKWQPATTSGTSYNEWQQVVQRVTTDDNKWQRMTTSDNKWQRLTKNDNEWQRVVILTNFPVFRIREEPTTMNPKETLNIEEDLEEKLLK